MLNKAMIIGNLGQDPDTRYMPSGGAVTNISVATSKKWKDKQTGEQKEATEWHKVAAFGKLAEIMAEYLRKGSKVYIEGSLRTRKWEKDGQNHYTTEIIADEMKMLGGKGGGSGDASGSMSTAAGGRPASSSPPGTPPDGRYTSEDFDDDIPF